MSPSSPTWPLVPPQFLQLRKSVVLTSNFAKSVVNLADMVRGFGSRGGWSPGDLSPRGLSPALVGLSPGGWPLVGLSMEGLVPST